MEKMELAGSGSDENSDFKFIEAVRKIDLPEDVRIQIKEDKPDKELLDRHKVCACMVTAIIKVRLLSGNLETDDGLDLSTSSRINEQLAFMSVWELFKGFIRLHGEKENSVIRKYWITVSEWKNYLFQNKTCHFFLLVIQSF